MFNADQAAGLRRLFSRKQLRSIIIGGAGKGKANIVANLAGAMAAKGDRVMVIDGSHGEIGNLFGLRLRYELNHILDGDKTLYETLHKCHNGIHLLPAAKGLTQLSHLDVTQARRLQNAFAQWREPVDTVLINAREKTCSGVIAALQRKATILMVVFESIDSITAAYSEIKNLNQQHDIDEFNIIIGSQKDIHMSTSIFLNLSDAARRYLSVNLHLKAIVPAGAMISKDFASMNEESLFYQPPISLSRPFRELALEIDKWLPPSSIGCSNRKEITHASVC